MIDVNDFVQYIVPIMFWLGFAVGSSIGLIMGIVIAVLVLRGE
jgi:hypothetical protein